MKRVEGGKLGSNTELGTLLINASESSDHRNSVKPAELTSSLKVKNKFAHGAAQLRSSSRSPLGSSLERILIIITGVDPTIPTFVHLILTLIAVMSYADVPAPASNAAATRGIKKLLTDSKQQRPVVGKYTNTTLRLWYTSF